MASLDSLPADQKAVLSLVLQRGRTFDEIAALLSIDRAAVRQRALEGFDALGPDTALDPLKRALITDYLLGQLPAPVAANVRNSIARNPPERAWARVIAAEIGPMAANGLPEIPSAASATTASEPVSASEPGTGPRDAARTAPVEDLADRDEPRPSPAPEQPAAAASSGFSDGPRSSRRGGAILLGLVALVVVVVVVVLLVTGGSSKKTPSTTTTASAGSTTQTSTTASGTTTSATPLHQINMVSPSKAKGREGAADVVRADGQLGLVLVAEGLVANTKNAYAVWLYNSTSGASDFLGFYSQKVTSTGSSKGALEAEVKLPTDATKYNELLVTLETAEKPTKPGTIVLEGAFAE